jgi:hypothetical protein
MKNVVDELRNIKKDKQDALYEKIVDYHDFLFSKFDKEITYKLDN